MTKILLTVLLTVTVVLPGIAEIKNTMRAMSFNIRYDNPEDGRQNWHHRKENIVRMINFYDVDIIGMQEVLVHQLNYLNDNLKTFNFVGVGREDGKDKGEFAPIFYRKEKYKEISSGTFWLSQTPDMVSKGWDAALERIATWAVLQDKKTGQEFLFMNTHFDHRGEKARVESSKLLKKKAIELALNKQLILTGDFNLVPESEGIQALLQPDDKNTIINSSDVTKYSYGPAWTSCGFDNRPFHKRKIIDYIFLKGIHKVSRYAVLAEMLNELYLSDHCPVLVELEL